MTRVRKKTKRAAKSAAKRARARGCNAKVKKLKSAKKGGRGAKYQVLISNCPRPGRRR